MYKYGLHSMSLTDSLKYLLVNKFSGGAKLTELLPFIVDPYITRFNIDDVNKILNEIKNDKDLKILTYYWETNGIQREKYFVCFKKMPDNVVMHY